VNVTDIFAAIMHWRSCMCASGERDDDLAVVWVQRWSMMVRWMIGAAAAAVLSTSTSTPHARTQAPCVIPFHQHTVLVTTRPCCSLYVHVMNGIACSNLDLCRSYMVLYVLRFHLCDDQCWFCLFNICDRRTIIHLSLTQCAHSSHPWWRLHQSHLESSMPHIRRLHHQLIVLTYTFLMSHHMSSGFL
jgi:hypothetical protein